MLSTGLKWTWVSLAVVCLDQAAKYMILQKLIPFMPYSIAPSLNFYLTYNRGTAMNIIRSANWIAAFISFLTICALAVWLSRLPEKFSILSLAIATIIGGTLGNLLDRLLHGHVVDFIQIYWRESSFYIFNIADVCIIGGLGGLIFASLRDNHLKPR